MRLDRPVGVYESASERSLISVSTDGFEGGKSAEESRCDIDISGSGLLMRKDSVGEGEWWCISGARESLDSYKTS